MEDVYERLRQKLDQLPIGFPKSDEAIEILKTLYTPEEAELAIRLPVLNKTLEEIAAELGENQEELRKKLERMADKGTVYAVEREGKQIYRLLPSLVGFSETPFWSGKKNERTKKLAPLWKKYFSKKFFHEIGDRKQSILRVIPVNTYIESGSKVTPYEDLAELIKANRFFAVANCPCRQMARYTGEGCDHSLEVCLHLDGMGEYIVKHGMGREITREETLEILRKSNEEGLVHMTENNQGKVATICNCCGDCCAFFRALKQEKLPRALARSNYVSRVDPDRCTACGTCAERCPMEAITVDEISVVDEVKCVGCGVCCPTCPNEAIRLVRKPEEKIAEIPDSKTYMMNLLKEKGII
jgi:formate hydrogenlyase subunit 6/NADH:ubiquinone oxidoreductase subunit I